MADPGSSSVQGGVPAGNWLHRKHQRPPVLGARGLFFKAGIDVSDASGPAGGVGTGTPGHPRGLRTNQMQ